MPFELVPPGTHIDFIGKRRICGALSIGVIVASFAAIPLMGIHWGIDFAGGTEMVIRFDGSVPVEEGAIRGVVKDCGVDADVVRYGEEGVAEFLIRFQIPDEGAPPLEETSCPITAEARQRLAEVDESLGGGSSEGDLGDVVDRLEAALVNAIGPHDVRRVESVGPRVGSELRSDGLWALVIACALIVVYIAFRFTSRFAPGAIVALVHDVVITAGIFVIFGLEFDLRVLAALLAILGYSLNDTIIIYDRIRENMEVRTKHDLIEVLNLSVNQTLARTVLTSGTTLVVVLALWTLGGEVIRPFAIAMTIGVVVGTYSSIFIAAPTLLLLERYMGEGGEGEPPAQGKGPGADRPRRRQARGKKSRAARKAARAARA